MMRMPSPSSPPPPNPHPHINPEIVKTGAKGGLKKNKIFQIYTYFFLLQVLRVGGGGVKTTTFSFPDFRVFFIKKGDKMISIIKLISITLFKFNINSPEKRVQIKKNLKVFESQS